MLECDLLGDDDLAAEAVVNVSVQQPAEAEHLIELKAQEQDGKPVAQWGMHQVDLNLTMGNLVEIVGKQATAWTHQHATGK